MSHKTQERVVLGTAPYTSPESCDRLLEKGGVRRGGFW
jgi:hypothetical protein